MGLAYHLGIANHIRLVGGLAGNWPLALAILGSIVSAYWGDLALLVQAGQQVVFARMTCANDMAQNKMRIVFINNFCFYPVASCLRPRYQPHSA